MFFFYFRDEIIVISIILISQYYFPCPALDNRAKAGESELKPISRSEGPVAPGLFYSPYENILFGDRNFRNHFLAVFSPLIGDLIDAPCVTPGTYDGG